MCSRFGHGGTALCLLLASAFAALASDVQLNNGKTYSNVTILQRDAEHIQIQVPYGEIGIPLDSIKSIDDVAVIHPASPPALLPKPDEGATLGTTSTLVLPLTTSLRRSPSPGRGGRATTNTASTASHTLPATNPAETYMCDFKMEGLLLVLAWWAAAM